MINIQHLLKTLPQRVIPFCLLLTIQCFATSSLDTQDIALSMQKVADRQIAHFRDTYSGRDEPHHIRDWTNGALYVGMLKWASISGDPRYQQWLKDLSDKGEWDLHWRTYMADDHIVGQLYLDLYQRYNDRAMLTKTKQRLDYIMANPSQQPIELDNYAHLERWTWCDALFMGPPVWAKMSSITGDRRYRDWMFSEFKATTDHLFDSEEGLFYRDNSYIGKLVDGEKIFWARGNGWVFAGLTLVMDELSPASKQYKYYKDLYLKMARTLLKIQTEKGHWSMSLLNAKTYPTPETSGTSFFTYGLAWGINNGILESSKTMPAIEKAWKALTSHITDEGMLGYVQPIGAAPGSAWPDKSEVYGTGAFLAAGSELYKLLGGIMPVDIPESDLLHNAISKSHAELSKEISQERKKKVSESINVLHARFVPERKDDFAWENDLVAFRAYGPALRDGTENAGTDCWLKRVNYPIIDKWYDLAVNKNQSYHQDHGEGLDNYHVGASAGCGGTALWINGKRESLETYVSYSNVKNRDGLLSFSLHYEKHIGSDQYKEQKDISLIAGTRLFKVTSTFWKNDELAKGMNISVGVTTHDEKADVHFNAQQKWLATWETIDGYGLGTAVFLPQASHVDTLELKAENKPDNAHALFITKTDQRGQLTYFAGYGWEHAKGITSPSQWHQYLTRFAQDGTY